MLKKLTLVLCLAFTATSCANKRAPILVGQSAVAIASSIEQLTNAGKQLQEASVMPTAVALNYQRALLAVNDKLKPLPDILRTIDNLETAGSSSASEVDRAIAILTVVGQDISVVVAGVPVSEATTTLINLVRTAQKTVQDVLIQVAQIKGAE